MDLQSLGNGGEPPAFSGDIDSASSIPFASTPSSPRISSSAATIFGGGHFFSCPTSPVHYVLSSCPYSATATVPSTVSSSKDEASSASFEFDSAVLASGLGEAMISADELFLDGKIRPRNVPSKWKQPLAPLANEEEDWEPLAAAAEEEGDVDRGRDLWIRTPSRRTRSMSPVRSPRFNLREAEPEDQRPEETTLTPAAVPASATSSGSSSSTSPTSTLPGKYARRWIFFKDLLHRSKSEGSGRGECGKEKDKFWHSLSFSPSSLKSKTLLTPAPAHTVAPEKQKAKLKRPSPDGSGGRRQLAAQRPRPSLHELHYAVNRAQAEEMRRRTFLPYRQGLLGCLVFGSRSYSAINGLARTLNPVSSR